MKRIHIKKVNKYFKRKEKEFKRDMKMGFSIIDKVKVLQKNQEFIKFEYMYKDFMYRAIVNIKKQSIVIYKGDDIFECDSDYRYYVYKTLLNTI